MDTLCRGHSYLRFVVEEVYREFAGDEYERLGGGLRHTSRVADWVEDTAEGPFSYSVTKTRYNPVPYLYTSRDEEDGLSPGALGTALEEEGLNGDCHLDLWYDDADREVQVRGYSWGNAAFDRMAHPLDPRRLLALVGERRRARFEGTLATDVDAAEAEQYVEGLKEEV